MSDFENFCLANGIPLKEVVTPLEKLLLRIGIISKPVGMLSYPLRALWFSITFGVLFLGIIELILQLVGISFFTAVPPNERFLSIIAILCFGPVPAFFSIRPMKKHRNVLITFRSDQ